MPDYLRSTRIIVQLRLCGCGIGGKKCLEEREGMNARKKGTEKGDVGSVTTCAS